jgi:glutaredoxin-like YruB-family protein
MEADLMNAPKKVVVYSTPTCPICKRAKQFLKDHNVPFQEIDVASDKAARDEMIRKSGQMGVPVIEIDGATMMGFDEATWKKELGV